MTITLTKEDVQKAVREYALRHTSAADSDRLPLDNVEVYANGGNISDIRARIKVTPKRNTRSNEEKEVIDASNAQ